MECKEMQAQNSTVIQMQERKKEEDLEKKMSREEVPALPAIWNHSRLILSSHKDYFFDEKILAMFARIS